jgi:hypothetical protein
MNLDLLRQEIEKMHVGTPQRLTLAKAYLQSLEWGMKGLATLGQTVGFTIMPPPPPQEYPKALYRRGKTRLANSLAEETQLAIEGFHPKQPEPEVQEPEPKQPSPPTIQVKMPDGNRTDPTAA